MVPELVEGLVEGPSKRRVATFSVGKMRLSVCGLAVFAPTGGCSRIGFNKEIAPKGRGEYGEPAAISRKSI